MTGPAKKECELGGTAHGEAEAVKLFLAGWEEEWPWKGEKTQGGWRLYGELSQGECRTEAESVGPGIDMEEDGGAAVDAVGGLAAGHGSQ